MLSDSSQDSPGEINILRYDTKKPDEGSKWDPSPGFVY